MCGAFQSFTSLVRDEPMIREAFVTGGGVGWHEHSHDLFEGTERFVRTGYAGNLVEGWLPALDGVVQKLEDGASVADVGCGLGASTILMAQAFPASTFVGEQRLNPVAINCDFVGDGRRSPASCSTVNCSNGISALRASTTQSR